MANGKDLELALRIKADLKQGQTELQQFEAALEQAAQQAQQTNTQLNTTAAAVDKLGTESAAAAASVKSVGNAAAASTAGLAQQVAIMHRAGLTAGQYNQATRMLPMQLTDVATSLASGMPLWMVAIQQGGQISDSFGGIGNALDLLGNKIGGLVGGAADRSLNFIGALTGGAEAAAVAQTALADGARDAAGAVEDAGGGLADAASSANDLAEAGERASTALASAPTPGPGLAIAAGFAVAAAAVAALVVAYRQGAAEEQAYNQALIMTGNAAGTNSDALAGMAQRIADANGTVGNAAQVLAEVAGTGKFAATQIEAIGAAAVAMEDATGRAVADTVAEFAKLAESPAAASAKLNQQYNYLTAAVYQQIRALEEQGDTQGAAQLATDTYAKVIQERAEQVVDSLGSLDRAWRAVGDGAAWAWDRMLDIGRPDALEEKLAGAYQELERLQKQRGPAAGGYDRKGAAEAEVARLQGLIQERDAKALEQGQQAAISQAGMDAMQQLDKAVASTASNADKLKARLKEIDEQAAAAARAGTAYSAEKLEQLRAAAREQYAAPVGAGQQYLDNLQRQVDLHGQASEAARVRYAIEQGELGKLTAELQVALIAEAEALDAKKAAADAAREAATAAEQQARQTEQLAREQLAYVASLERQAATVDMTADQVRAYELAEKGLTGALRERAEAALAVVAAGEKQKQLDEDLARMTERSAQLQRSMASSSRSRREQADNELAGYGLGQRERDRIASERDIRDEYQGAQAELDEATPKDLLGSPEYLAESAKLAAGLNTELERNADSWARSQQAMGDWSAGASEAFANYMDQAQDISGQTEDMIGSAMQSLTQGVADSFAQAIVYGEDLRTTMAGVAQTILSEVLSSLIQMGIRYGINAMLEAAAIQTVTATKVAADATQTASAIASTTAVTATQTAAAATTTAAWTPAAIATSIGSFGTAAAIGLAAVVAALAFSAFKDGGEVHGPGTGTSDDIPAWLSNGEFVTREAVVSQPGAKAFLNDFNGRGMAALDDWATRVRHSTGGLAGVPAPAMPAPSLGNVQLAEPTKALGGATVQNAINLYAVQDEAQVASMAWGKSGQEHFMVYLQRNAQTVKSILKV